MKNIKFLATILLILTLTTSLFGQGTFKNYKDEKTGKITAYSEGIKKISESKNSWDSDEVMVELYPYFTNGNYYFIISTYNMPDYKYYNGMTDVIKNADGNIYLLIELHNGDKVVQLKTYRQLYYHNRDEELMFEVTKEQVIHTAISPNIKIKISPTKILKYENYDYSFSKQEVNGFKDFAIGMNLISKD